MLTLLQKKVGILPKDTSSGPFVDEWKKAYGDISKEIEEIDIAPALSQAAFSIKGQEELVCADLPFLPSGLSPGIDRSSASSLDRHTECCES
jgi:hypothetical protein